MVEECETFVIKCLMNGLPQCLSGKESTRNEGEVGLIPGWGRPPGGGHGNPIKYSCLENPLTEEPGGLQYIGLQRVGHK